MWFLIEMGYLYRLQLYLRDLLYAVARNHNKHLKSAVLLSIVYFLKSLMTLEIHYDVIYWSLSNILLVYPYSAYKIFVFFRPSLSHILLFCQIRSLPFSLWSLLCLVNWIVVVCCCNFFYCFHSILYLSETLRVLSFLPLYLYML